jgi:hypothetical protein
MTAHEDFLSWADLEPKLNALISTLNDDDVDAIGSMMKHLVMGYSPSSEIIDWVFMEKSSQLNNLS